MLHALQYNVIQTNDCKSYDHVLHVTHENQVKYYTDTLLYIKN